MTNSGSLVTLNLQQSAEDTGKIACVQYDVVIPHTFGDDVWGSVTANGNITPTAQKFTLYGKSTSFSGCKMRLSKVVSSSNDGIHGNDGHGEVYNGN